VTNPSAPNSYVSLTELPGFLRLSASRANGGSDYWLLLELPVPPRDAALQR
jgi:hypothetical protein